MKVGISLTQLQPLWSSTGNFDEFKEYQFHARYGASVCNLSYLAAEAGGSLQTGQHSETSSLTMKTTKKTSLLFSL
jgi:hypothetical protein